jgi:hypothetical protein
MEVIEVTTKGLDEDAKWNSLDADTWTQPAGERAVVVDPPGAEDSVGNLGEEMIEPLVVPIEVHGDLDAADDRARLSKADFRVEAAAHARRDDVVVAAGESLQWGIDLREMLVESFVVFAGLEWHGLRSEVALALEYRS